MIKFFNPGPGVLQQNPQTMMMGQQPVLAGATGNARGSNRMPQIPNNRIGLGALGAVHCSASVSAAPQCRHGGA